MYAGNQANESQTSFDFVEVLPSDDATDVASREWQRLRENLALIRAQIQDLQSKEETLQSQVDAWLVILSAAGMESTPELNDEAKTAPIKQDRPMTNKQESANAVVDLLHEVGGALHYRQIYEKLAARGIEVKGKNPPNTLLARFFDDPRLERVRQGTYQIKPLEEVKQDE